MGRADALQQRRQFLEALQLIEEAIAINSPSDAARLAVHGADLYAALGDLNSAEALLRPISEGLVAGPQNFHPDALFRRGQYRLLQRQPEEAVSFFQKAIQKYGELDGDFRQDRAVSLANTAGALVKTGHKAEAHATASLGVKTWNDLLGSKDGYLSDGFAHFQLGYLHHIIGNLNEAKHHWGRVLPSDGNPLTSESQASLAYEISKAALDLDRAAESERECDRAVAFWRGAMEKPDMLAHALRIQANARRVMGLYTTAEKSFIASAESFLELQSPEFRSAAAVFDSLAIMCIQMRRYEDAIQWIDKAEELVPRFPLRDPHLSAILLNNRGECLNRMGNNERAKELWRESIRTSAVEYESPNTAELNLLAMEAREGSRTALKSQIRQAAEMKPWDERLPWELGELAACLYLHQQEDVALEHWRRGRDLMFQTAADIDVRPAEYLEAFAFDFDQIQWTELTSEMRFAAAEVRKKAENAVEAAFPDKQFLG